MSSPPDSTNDCIPCQSWTLFLTYSKFCMNKHQSDNEQYIIQSSVDINYALWSPKIPIILDSTIPN